ncbi:choice-of-anchor B family protein [Aequorivita sp. SDUM287046]|uniref:Choice-of-anchor B family protein n=1 Tax=Aequorivita aurantiaca TaxID=3053356 RepID=A0ABT8DCP4_9FLAO|nr:choice-of-anchor B family protein [Aequorivita aurantiaca]MDN3722895.1 choice-of-anchor B family protein [Aequorivita aurantiaca]
MKRFLPLVTLFISSFVFAQTPCINGTAGQYPCEGLDLMSRITLNTFGSDRGNDSWGWTDPQDGKEYAIMGLGNGTAFVDITDPVNPIYLGKLPTHTDSSTWRDIKVYNNYAFIVSEASGHGMQVFDLTRLRSVSNAPETFTEDAHYNGFGHCHNLVINEETGFAYAVGTSTFGGGPHFVNIQNPLSPTAAGGFGSDNYCHDAQVVIYDGPDADYAGREIFFGSNEDRVSIVDVTDKNNPIGISNGFYGSIEYTHQGWLTEDKRYFIIGDELDESAFGFNTRTIIFDVSDLDNPVVHFEYEADQEAIDHNGYVLGNDFYLSSYRAGLRILDISDIENGNMAETKYFDTYPGSDSANFDGAWSVYPFFASGNIVISDINRGLFIVRDALLGLNEATVSSFALYPNPAKNIVTVSSKIDPLEKIEVFNVLGQKVMDLNFVNTLSENIDISKLQTGMYVLKINASTTKRLLVD